MAGAGTLEALVRHVGLALQPLQQRLAPDNVVVLLAELGLQFPPQVLQPGFVSALSAGVGAAGALPGTIAQLTTSIENGDDPGTIQAGLQLIQEVATTISSFDNISTQLKSLAGSLPGMNSAEVTTFAQNLPSRLLSYSLITYLENSQPGMVAIGNLLGVLDDIRQPGVAGDPVHPPHTGRAVQLSRLGDLLSSPTTLAKSLFGWGSAGFDGTLLMPRLAATLNLLGDVSANVGTNGKSLDSSLISLKAAPGNPPRLTGSLQSDLPTGIDLILPLSPRWSAHFKAQGTLAAGLQVTIAPPTSVSLKPPSGTLSGLVELDLIAKGPDADHPIILIGQTGGSRLQTDTFTLGAGLTLNWDSGAGAAAAEPLVSLAATGGKAVIDFSQADGFVATVTSGVHAEAAFDLKITWQPDIGIHIDGGAQFDLALPLHLDLGPVSIPTLYLSAGADSNGVPLEVSVALGVTLGPFQASVDRIGVKALLSFPDHDGNLGPADLSIKFKPPNGLGISVDAGVVAGGGYISFDPDKGEYAGVLELSLADIVQVKVIGILDTKMPDGSPGYSLLLIITFDLPPIQLGFGFTLNGVGGIAGVNRTMSIDALHAGFRAHTLDSIMFPPDPIKNAPQIISNVRDFFPPAEGRYLFGPMVEFGWGTPTLITLSVGVILEVPDPIRLAILGLIHAGLPTADIALIELHIDVLGTYDGGTKALAIDGSLYDSHVLIFSLAGDLALRLNMGSDPSFLFSLGGFNPHFNTAGLDIPAMQRMSVSIGDGDNPRISANAYFAVTSNSLQFGANVEAYAEAAGFSVHGYLGFDVLIIYSPFSFEFDFYAGFDVAFEGVSLCGIDLDGMLSGPRPWHIHGHAELHILFFTVGATLDLTWGDSTPAVLPQRAVLPDLLPALQDPGNWSTALPDGASQAVSLQPLKPDGKTLRVHPMGTLSVREKIVPLDQTITRYGNATPSDGTSFAIGGVTINSQSETQQSFQDYFATGQFFTLSDADKLSAPSFEKYDAGITIGSDTVLTGADSPRNVVYEERYVDEPEGFSRLARLYAMPADIHLSLSALGAGFASPLKNTGLAKYRTGPTAAAVVSQDPSYVIAGVEDLAVRHDIVSSQGATYFAARAALQSHLAAHPEDAANLQILPVHEAAA
jgi:hypothetical protein